jgi:hypothetical protein
MKLRACGTLTHSKHHRARTPQLIRILGQAEDEFA